MRHVWLAIACVVVCAGGVEAGGWDRPKALAFLESRQQAWAAWPPAQKPGGACISCHSGLSYVFALKAIGAPVASEAEQALVRGVVQRATATPPTPTMSDAGADAVLNLLLLSLQRHTPAAPLTTADQAALATVWDRQIRHGDTKGSWTWVDAQLEPFDAPHSTYFGTALAALALSAYPAQDARRVTDVETYLRRARPAQPLHDQVAYLAFAPRRDRESTDRVLSAVWRAQAADGGWTTASMGPWLPQEGNPPDPGSNAYMTAWVAFSAQRSGVPCADLRLARSLDWLEQRQDRATGAWYSPSMNKVYRPGSIQEGFMTDAASGYAVAVLVSCGR